KANAFTLVAVGSLIPRKRMHLILDAMHLLSDEEIRFVCIGNGPERKRLEKRTRKYGLQGRVTWHRFLPSREIARVLRKSHLLVSTSERETFGIVVAEAMMCGVPVLCTASGGPEEFVTPGCGRVIDVDASAEDIAAEISNIRRDYAGYRPEVNAAQAAAQFSQNKVMESIVAGYRNVISVES
ncbi:MAG: glycosyltransferase, partial [Saprospiraceae bacterium]|nr:glycosyltransferase [Saprospiraceae bacterium]